MKGKQTYQKVLAVVFGVVGILLLAVGVLFLFLNPERSTPLTNLLFTPQTPIRVSLIVLLLLPYKWLFVLNGVLCIGVALFLLRKEPKPKAKKRGMKTTAVEAPSQVNRPVAPRQRRAARNAHPLPEQDHGPYAPFVTKPPQAHQDKPTDTLPEVAKEYTAPPSSPES